MANSNRIAWRMQWTVSLAHHRAIHRSGLVVNFDTDGKRQLEYWPNENARAKYAPKISRLLREASFVYGEARGIMAPTAEA